MRAAVRLPLLALMLVAALAAGLLAVSRTAVAAQPAAARVPVSGGVETLVVFDRTMAIARANGAVTARLQAVAVHAQAVQIKVTRTKLVNVARKQLGDRYSAGSSGPNAFDCSGLTRYVYKTVTGKELPHNSHAQYARVKKISKKDAQPGDLVFFFRGGAHHVGIYIGKGRMIDARGYGEGVKVSPISGSWWGRAYSGMGRILPKAPTV